MPRGDGRLSHDLLPGEKGPQDACGVFGVWAPDEQVAKLAYFGLYALQHRGQESAGIAVSDGANVWVYKDMGLVSQVFTEAALDSLHGHIAVGHTRYSTTGSSVWENAQPTFRSTATGHLALGHNGNLTNTHDLARRVREREGSNGELPLGASTSTSDTDLLTSLIASHPDLSIEAAAMEELPQVRGAYSLVFMDETTLYAARDPQGIRPLTLGKLERGWVHRSSGRSSPESSSRLTSMVFEVSALLKRRPKVVSSSSFTWPVLTPQSPGMECMRFVLRLVVNLLVSSRLMQI